MSAFLRIQYRAFYCAAWMNNLKRLLSLRMQRIGIWVGGGIICRGGSRTARVYWKILAFDDFDTVELARVFHHARAAFTQANRHQHIFAFDQFTENAVFTIQPGGRGMCDEEQSAVGVWTCVCHAQDAAHVPVHWDLSGQADRFATREEALATFALLPGASVALTLLLALIPAIEPLRENLQRGRRAYLTAWFGAQAMIALVSVGLALMFARGAGGATSDVDLFVRAMIAGGAVLLVLLGDALVATPGECLLVLGLELPQKLVVAACHDSD